MGPAAQSSSSPTSPEIPEQLFHHIPSFPGHTAAAPHLTRSFHTPLPLSLWIPETKKCFPPILFLSYVIRGGPSLGRFPDCLCQNLSPPPWHSHGTLLLHLSASNTNCWLLISSLQSELPLIITKRISQLKSSEQPHAAGITVSPFYRQGNWVTDVKSLAQGHLARMWEAGFALRSVWLQRPCSLTSAGKGGQKVEPASPSPGGCDL